MKIADTSAQDREIPKKTPLKLYFGAGIAGIIVVVLAIIVFPHVSRWGRAETSVATDRLSFATVRLGDLISDISIQGKVVSGASPTVYAQQPGVLTLHVDIGDRVSEGQVLGTIAHAFLSTQLQRENTQLAFLEAQLNRTKNSLKQREMANKRNRELAEVEEKAARREAERAQISFDSASISDVEYRKTMDNLESAELRLNHAIEFESLDKESFSFEIEAASNAVEQQKLVIAEFEEQVNQLTIRAPLAGSIGNILVERQGFVNPGIRVLTVVDLTNLEVEAAVAQTYADELSPGITAEIRVDSNVFEGLVMSVSQEVVNNLVPVRLKFAGETPSGLRRNQRVSVRLLLAEHEEVLIVSRGPFLESGGHRIAYVVEDGLAVKREIEVGALSVRDVEIVSGLNPDDEIITSDTSRFNGAETVLLRN